MQAGNTFYRTAKDLPSKLPLLSQPSVVLLPAGFVSLTIEDDYQVRMIDDIMGGNRLVGIIQSCTGTMPVGANDNHSLYDIGCIGRITTYSEIGDGKILISLQGICRFRLSNEVATDKSYRCFSIKPFYEDLKDSEMESEIDRNMFLSVFQDYLELNDMQADWDTILEASDETLVNALSTMVPFDSAEKQALLEAPDLKTRCDTLIAIAERSIIGQGEGRTSYLQ